MKRKNCLCYSTRVQNRVIISGRTHKMCYWRYSFSISKLKKMHIKLQLSPYQFQIFNITKHGKVQGTLQHWTEHSDEVFIYDQEMKLMEFQLEFQTKKKDGREAGEGTPVYYSLLQHITWWTLMWCHSNKTVQSWAPVSIGVCVKPEKRLD